MFCARGNLSKEHVWPAWAAEHLPAAVARDETLQTVVGSDAQTQTNSRPGSLKHKKLRVVCAFCNSGWMSVIENDAKYVVMPMMLGQGLLLDESAQRLLARWIALKIMVVDQSPPDAAAISPEERKAFMEQGAMSERLHIELASCGEAPWDTDGEANGQFVSHGEAAIGFDRCGRSKEHSNDDVRHRAACSSLHCSRG
jgi:hypothetical protein